MADPTRIYKSHLQASTINNLSADRANIAKLRANVAEIDVLTVTTSVDLPDGSLLINSSGTGAILTTVPGGGVLTNNAFSLKTLTSNDASIAIMPSNNEIDLSVGAGGITTLASAGGTTIITDGTGPSLAIKGQGTSPLLALSNTATTFGFDNICIRIRDAAGTLPPAANPANATQASSVAIGADATATGVSTVAIGNGAAAADTNAIGIGTTCSSNAPNTVAIGQSANATGADTVAIGTGATASGPDSVAEGNGALASVSFGVSIGSGSQVINSQTGGVAIGWDANVNTAALGNGRSVAVGPSVEVQGDLSAFVGNNVICTVPTACGFGLGDQNASGTITQAEPGFLAARKAAGLQLTYAYEGETQSLHQGVLWHQWHGQEFPGASPYNPTAAQLVGRNHVLTVNPTTVNIPAAADITALSSSWGTAANVVRVPQFMSTMFMISNQTGAAFTLAVPAGYTLRDVTNGAYVGPTSKTLADGINYVLVLSSTGVLNTFDIFLLGGFNAAPVWA